MYKSLLIAVMACFASQTMIGMQASEGKPQTEATQTSKKPIPIVKSSQGVPKRFYTFVPKDKAIYIRWDDDEVIIPPKRPLVSQPPQQKK